MPFKNYEPAEMMLSKPSSIKKGCYTCQWLDSVDMHFYDPYILCFSKDIGILLTDNGQTDCWIIIKTQRSCKIIVQTQWSCNTHIVIVVQTQGSCNFNTTSKPPRVVQYSADPRVVHF